MDELLNSEIFSEGSFSLTIAQAILCAAIITTAIIIWKWTSSRFNRYLKTHQLSAKDTNRILVFKGIIFFFLIIVCILVTIDIVPTVFTLNDFELKLSSLLLIAVLILLARITDMIISSRIIEEMGPRHQQEIIKRQYSHEGTTRSITRVLDFFILGIIGILVLRGLKLDRAIDILTIKGTKVDLHISNIIAAILVILAARIILWAIINFFLYNFYKRRGLDAGKQYAYNQLSSYIIYVIAVVIAMQTLGINMTLIWGGAAALLVGVGLALQQTISDFFSGLVLLFERSIEVGDFVVVGADKGTIIKIGIRASVIETLERKDIVVPNSKLVNNTVINWNNTKNIARFDVQVGVAYGSNTVLVKQLLIKAAQEHKSVLKNPAPFVRFLNFGDSSLDFGIYFFSNNYLRIEDVQSDIRFTIDQLFRENNITIPFPQRDLWIKTSGNNELNS